MMMRFLILATLLLSLGDSVHGDDAARNLQVVSDHAREISMIAPIDFSYEGSILLQSEKFQEKKGSVLLLRHDVVRHDDGNWQRVKFSKNLGSIATRPVPPIGWTTQGVVEVHSETVQNGQFVSCFESHRDGVLQLSNDVVFGSFPTETGDDFVKSSWLELRLGVYRDRGMSANKSFDAVEIFAYDVLGFHEQASKFVVTGKDTIDGKTATVVEWSGVTRLWLDDERPQLVLRREVLDTSSKKPRFVWSYSGYSQREGILLPQSIVEQRFDVDGEEYSETRIQLRELNRGADVSALRQPQVPVGTPVANLAGGPHFPYYPGESNPDEVIRSIGKIRERTDEAASTSPWYFRLFLVTSCLVVLVIVAKIVRRK